MIEVEFRPITSWSGSMTPEDARQRSPFKASYHDTLTLLDHELDMLRARRPVIELALRSDQIRIDGWPKANASEPEHPGVIVSFESKHGPLRYATDQFRNGWGSQYLRGWQANLRAIALGLEALRKVDRYGITKRGEQYTGWSALPPGTIAAAAAPMSVDQALTFIAEAAGWTTPPDIGDPFVITCAYREAAKRHHPDTGGDAELFKKLGDAKRLLEGRTS